MLISGAAGCGPQSTQPSQRHKRTAFFRTEKVHAMRNVETRGATTVLGVVLVCMCPLMHFADALADSRRVNQPLVPYALEPLR
jgi:hypothetical protein